jgi:cytochrome c
VGQIMENAVKFSACLVPMLSLATFAVPAMAQDADGGALFKQRCQMCHTVDAGKPAGLAPNLAGVVGRKAASTAFNYSPALKASGLTWSKATLDSFLTAPMKLVPGTRMVIAIPDPQQRAAVIAYLASTKK